MLMLLIGAFYLETTPAHFSDGQWDPLIYVSRRLQVESANPSDSGAVEIYPRFDANRDGYYDLMSAVAIGGAGGYIKLWFGSATGYSSGNYWQTQSDSGGNMDMADLNLDGWPELIHSGWGTDGGKCTIYWGSPTGYSPSDTTRLPNGNAEAVYVYDLDKDSYLDILLAGDNGTLYVYWGGPGGYSSGNRSTRSLNTVGHNIEVADLNKDGWPDVVLPTGSLIAAEITILWGDATPRDLGDNTTWSHVDGSGYSHGVTLGDFNRDGWIDIVRSGYGPWPLGAPPSKVYFSNNGTFSSGNSISLNVGHCYGGSAAYDFNGDGWLDLVFFRGRPGRNEQFQLLMYRNSGSSPYFSDANSTGFGPQQYYTGGFVWDFNRDGKPEIFANNGCGYGLQSYVLWGVRLSGSSVVYDSMQSLPVTDDHHGGFRECGNVYDRSPYAWYESGVFSHTNLQTQATLSWIAWEDNQVGARVRMYIRTRWDASSPWSGWREVSNGELVSESPYFPARDIQYRAEFLWDNPAYMPWLERVQLETQPLSVEDAQYHDPEKPSFGSGRGLIWVSWPGHEAEVSLYSSDGRRLGLESLNNGRAEFRGLSSGVYYIFLSGERPTALKVILR
ncbi:MAG: VCBS repeat-containing protein [candidate division WOR-3 bacterium]